MKTAPLPSLRGRLLRSNLGMILLSLAVSVAVLLLLIYNILGGFIQNDVDFALREISGNLHTKTVLMEDMLLRLRGDTVVMDRLDQNALSSEDAEFMRFFLHAANLYSDKNTEQLSGAFLDIVYLFDRAGNSVRASYTDLTLGRQRQADAEFSALRREFLASGQDTAIYPGADKLRIAYVVYDRQMQNRGTVIFSVNNSAVRELLQKTAQYQEFFWFVWDKNGAPMLANNSFSLTGSQCAEVVSARRTAPHDQRVGTVGYRVYTLEMSMGLGVSIGVASDQLRLLLFDSVKYYVLVLVVLLTLMVLALFFYIVRLTRPLSEVAESLRRVANENFEEKLPEYDSREFRMISDTFNTMTDTINHLINDVYEKRLIAMDSELKFLQSQMNPHFLYNVLNTISLKAKLDGNEEIYRMASNFSGLTQARLYHSGDEKITIEQELQLVRFYLELQKSRFEDKLTYHITVQDDSLLSCQIPKLTLELIVENAVIHGIEPKSGPGTVYVDVSADGGALLFHIEDDGVGFEGGDGLIPLPTAAPGARKDGHNHIALENAEKIIKLYYGSSYGITIQSRQGVGTMVLIRLPLDREEGTPCTKSSLPTTNP